jgi:hypothetical protein
MIDFSENYMLGEQENGKLKPTLYIRWYGWTVFGYFRKWDTVIKQWDAWPFIGRYRSRMWTAHMFSERISDFWMVGA